MEKISNKHKSVIHVAKAKTGMDDDEYRALLSRFGVTTSSDLTTAQFDQVMAHFETLGFRSVAKTKTRIDSRAKLTAKVKAIMDDMGLHTAYVDGMARRMFKNKDGVPVSSWAWLTDMQLSKLVAALTYHQRRAKGKAS